MKDHIRADVAAIALAHWSGKKVNNIYDHAAGRYMNIDVAVNNSEVIGYDYTTRGHISGTIPLLYHYGERHHIKMEPKENGRYLGYDYGTRCHFEVTVRDQKVEVYDHEQAALFSYSC